MQASTAIIADLSFDKEKETVGNESVEVGSGGVNEAVNEGVHEAGNLVGNESVEVGSGCVNEVGNEGVHDIGNLVEIQVNVEGENEIVNEGQTVNELVKLPLKNGLDRVRLENEAENQPSNQPVKDKL
nr:hypothetical protein Iba_chr14dCG4380 [Ipomoea batatas]